MNKTFTIALVILLSVCVTNAWRRRDSYVTTSHIAVPAWPETDTCPAKYDKPLYESEMGTLIFKRDSMITNTRSDKPVVPQISCSGPNCSYMPAEIMCKKRGKSWKCNGAFRRGPDGEVYTFGHSTIVHQFYKKQPDSDKRYLSGSSRLKMNIISNHFQVNYQIFVCSIFFLMTTAIVGNDMSFLVVIFVALVLTGAGPMALMDHLLHALAGVIFAVIAPLALLIAFPFLLVAAMLSDDDDYTSSSGWANSHGE